MCSACPVGACICDASWPKSRRQPIRPLTWTFFFMQTRGEGIPTWIILKLKQKSLSSRDFYKVWVQAFRYIRHRRTLLTLHNFLDTKHISGIIFFSVQLHLCSTKLLRTLTIASWAVSLLANIKLSSLSRSSWTKTKMVNFHINLATSPQQVLITSKQLSKQQLASSSSSSIDTTSKQVKNL
jgi:hypothetical protein